MLFRRSKLLVATYNAPTTAAAKAAGARDSRSSTASSTSLNVASRGLSGTRCCSADWLMLLAVWRSLVALNSSVLETHICVMVVIVTRACRYCYVYVTLTSVKCGTTESMVDVVFILIELTLQFSTYGLSLTISGHIKTAEQRTIIQQYSDWYTCR